MNDSEEKEYWHAFIEGDLDALAILFLQYAKGLISYGMKICPDEEIVNDSIQEVFIQLIQKRHKLKQKDQMRGLVYRLLRNKVIDEIKRINRSKRIDNLIFNSSSSIEMDAEYHLIGFEEENKKNAKLNSALEKLSVHQKEAMFLKYTNDFSYEQISEVMGISIASSRTLIYRTLKQLKSLLSDN
ncbi:MAG: sigma-70 family RNA polymerase sigma factor [Bacteroidota bacterium]|nr:sigma-70 family RNA polymerase sigma factor [Bacteroidota bacterium]